MTATTSRVETGSTPYDDLAGSVRGELITPDHAGYDDARKVYNAMIDRRPAAIVRCWDVADVRACVRFATEHGVEIAVRGGGHNANGLGVWDNALVIDLSPMHSTTVSPDTGTVRVDGGCTWGDVDHATVEFGLATPSGIVSTTGVGGLSLGGGIGYLARKYGLTADNLVSADVVLADGSLVTASETSHPDLFWALRGGGGNFGVVTSFVFRCHPVGENGTIIGGPVLYDMADTAEVLRWYRDLQPSLPDDINGWFGLLTIPGGAPFPEELWGKKACGIVWAYTGPHDKADEAFAPGEGVRLPAPLRRPARCRSAVSSRPSTRSTRRGCSGTGAPTSSRRSPTRRSRRTASTAPPCRPGSRRCTCTRSTERPPGSAAGTRLSPTETAAGPASSSASTRTPRTTRRSRRGPRTSGRSCTPPQPVART